MKIEILSREKAKQSMADWLNNGQEIINLPSSYDIIRHDLSNAYIKIEEENNDLPKKDYMIDINFGVFLTP